MNVSSLKIFEVFKTMDFSSIDIQTALIAAIVSIIMWLLSFFFEPIKSKVTRYFILKTEHKYSEKRKIKEILSEHKMTLLLSAEELNYRIWNLYTNYKEEWHNSSGDYYTGISGYYTSSFLYRISVFYAWIYKTENEMKFIDTTYADKKDLEFLKYLRMFQKILCRADTIIKFDKEYNPSVQKDHIFFNQLSSQCKNLININNFTDDVVFMDWLSGYHNVFFSFLDNINPDEDRYRWDILHLLHILLISFLNSYGYDYQKTNNKQLQKLLSQPYSKQRLINCFVEFIKEFKMDTQKELRNLISLL